MHINPPLMSLSNTLPASLPVHTIQPSKDHPHFSGVQSLSPTGILGANTLLQDPGYGFLPRQRLCVTLRSMLSFNLGNATCDSGAQDEQTGLECQIAPAPLDYQSIWTQQRQEEKRGE